VGSGGSDALGRCLPGRIATALAVFIDTGGGTLQLTGTAEAGRVRVINTAGMAVADVGWMSMSGFSPL
jgi:hypothetical protein